MKSYSEESRESRKAGDRKAQKAPAFQFYAGDFLVGTAMMSAEEVGGYIRLLCYQWTHGGIPNDDTVLQRLTGCGGNAVASIRHKFGINLEGELVNERLEEVRSERDAFVLKQAKNAAKRWEIERQKKVGTAKADAVALPNAMPDVCSSVFSLQSSKIILAQQPEATADAAARGRKKPRTVDRNPILDALAVIGGGKAEEIPPGNWAGIAKALSEIRAVCPELTIEELQRRARNYRTRFEGAALTPFALAKHWATCGTSKWSEQGSQVYR